MTLAKRRILVFVCGLVFVIAWPPVAWLSMGTLEWRYRAGVLPPPDIQAVVLLGGGVSPVNPSLPEALPGMDSFLRAEYTKWLLRQLPPVPLLVSGGSTSGGTPVSLTMANLLRAEGIPGSSIWTEKASTSTYENAVDSARILRDKGIHRIALVTHANHMPRAAAAFRHQGLQVFPTPCCFLTLQYRLDATLFLPSAQAILINEAALHEWIGLGWYRLLGRI